MGMFLLLHRNFQPSCTFSALSAFPLVWEEDMSLLLLMVCLFLHLSLGLVSSYFLSTGSVPSAHKHVLECLFKCLSKTYAFLSSDWLQQFFFAPISLEQRDEYICLHFLSPLLWPQSQSDQCSFPRIAQSGSFAGHHASMSSWSMVHCLFSFSLTLLHHWTELATSSSLKPHFFWLLWHPLFWCSSFPTILSLSLLVSFFLYLIPKCVCPSFDLGSHCPLDLFYSRVNSSGSILQRKFMDESKIKIFLGYEDCDDLYLIGPGSKN